jgi:hypothetical protein
LEAPDYSERLLLQTRRGLWIPIPGSAPGRLCSVRKRCALEAGELRCHETRRSGGMKCIASTVWALAVSAAAWAPAWATVWSGPEGWSAANFIGGDCTLQIPLGVVPRRLLLRFTSPVPPPAEPAERIVFSVLPSLEWPMKMRLGSATDGDAKTLYLQADPSKPPALSGLESRQLLDHL